MNKIKTYLLVIGAGIMISLPFIAMHLKYTDYPVY